MISHYITLYYIMLHYVTLCYITLHYIILYYIILYYIILCYIICQAVAPGRYVSMVGTVRISPEPRGARPQPPVTYMYNYIPNYV